MLLLVSEGKMSVARAGEILGLEGRISAIRWYTGHGLHTPTSPKKASPTISNMLLTKVSITPDRRSLLRSPAEIYESANRQEIVHVRDVDTEVLVRGSP